jgi:predicted RNA-binding protein YlqC (UPF0109 family)
MAPDPEDMRKLLVRLVRELTHRPDAVSVRMTESSKSVRLLLRVDQSDVARVIGPNRRTVDSLMKILNFVSVCGGRKYIVDIDECDVGE